VAPHKVSAESGQGSRCLRPLDGVPSWKTLRFRDPTDVSVIRKRNNAIPCDPEKADKQQDEAEFPHNVPFAVERPSSHTADMSAAISRETPIGGCVERLVLRPGPRARQLLYKAHLLAVGAAHCHKWVRQDVAAEMHAARRDQLIAECRELRAKALMPQNVLAQAGRAAEPGQTEKRIPALPAANGWASGHASWG
jgi:hypothetical protein